MLNFLNLCFGPSPMNDPTCVTIIINLITLGKYFIYENFVRFLTLFCVCVFSEPGTSEMHTPKRGPGRPRLKTSAGPVNQGYRGIPGPKPRKPAGPLVVPLGQSPAATPLTRSPSHGSFDDNWVCIVKTKIKLIEWNKEI